MATAFIAVGSNLGDRAGHLAAAKTGLESRGVRVVRQSSTIETAPVGGPAGQGPYLNGAWEIETTLEPEALVETLLEVERALGRERTEKWGPRTIDLDLLLYEDRVIDEPGLTLPHPRMHERRFVLEPLAEIAPEVRHPLLKRTVRELLASLV